MNKVILSLLGLFIGSISFAADKFEAYIILLNKDTVRGYVITNNLETLCLQVDFESSNGTLTTYKPGEIKKFGVNVLDVWRRYTLLDLGEPAGLKDTSSNLLFAQVLTDDGPVKAYKYRVYQNKPGHYSNDIYVKGERALMNETCLIKGTEVLRLQNTSLFGNTKKKLREFFADCPTALASLNNIKNAVEEVPGLVRQYNRCSVQRS